MKTTINTLFLILTFVSFGQDRWAAFENLVGNSWVSEGKQLGGFDGKTIFEMEWGLNRQIVKVKTYTTDPETKEFGLRNEGIRAYNAQTDQLEFYEFDKLGGITSGKITIEGNNIHFEYTYDGLSLRDSWIYQSTNEYTFVVGVWEDGAWGKKFHETTYSRKMD